MKKLLMVMLLMPIMVLAETEVVDGIEWTYWVENGKATLGTGSYSSGLAVSRDTIGAIVIPPVLGGCPVMGIDRAAFYDCSKLTGILLPDGLLTIGDEAFRGCLSLATIQIPSSVTSIGGHAFYGCSSLTAVQIPKGVTSIGFKAFYCCSSLTSVVIPEGVTSVGDYAFYFCSGLTSVTIPFICQGGM